MMHLRIDKLVTGLFACLLLAWAVAVSRADSTDERFLQGLRARRLFQLAEGYCRDRLTRSDLPETERAAMTIELSRSFADHALHSPPAVADPLWTQAIEVIREFETRSPQSSFLPLTRTQAGLVWLARGEMQRQQSEVVAENRQLLDAARTYLRSAVKELSDAEALVVLQLRQLQPGVTPAFTRDQLLSLQRNQQRQLARTFRNQGLCHPPGSPDRTNSLSQALELLEPLAQLATSDPLSWEARVDEVACFRLIGDLPAANRRLGLLLANAPPDEFILLIRAEEVRLALAAGRVDAALDALKRGRGMRGQASGELDLAFVETYLAAWRAAANAKDDAQARHWESQVAAMIGEIQQSHGAYWSRRAESLLAGQVTLSTPPGDLETLIRAAEGYYRRGQFDTAVVAYDRAQTLAVTQQNMERAFELGFIAATIEHDRKQHRGAADRFRALALSSPQHSRAAEAHLLAIFNVAQEAKRSEPVSTQEYAAWLEEHLRYWPRGPSSDQARWQLGRLLESQSQWHAALAQYREISPEFPQLVAVVRSSTDCYGRQLADRAQRGENSADLITAAADHFLALVTAGGDRFPEKLSPAQQQAATSAAAFLLAQLPANTMRAEQVLVAALAASPDAEPGWKGTANSLLVSALAGQGRWTEAQARLNDSAAGPALDQLRTLQGLSALSESANPSARREVAVLQLHLIAMLAPRRGTLEPRQQLALDRIHAQALIAQGNQAAARQLLEELAKAHPQDGDIQEELANLLSAAMDRPTLEAALTKWRELEQKSRPNTPRWFRAKYQLALTHERLGNKAHAAKIATLTRLLHPELGGPELKSKFEALIARCQ